MLFRFAFGRPPPAPAAAEARSQFGIPGGVQFMGPPPWAGIAAAQSFFDATREISNRWCEPGFGDGGSTPWIMDRPEQPDREEHHLAWKDRYRCAVTISVDFDAETLWSGTFKLTTPSPLSRGDYDIRAGLPRILALLARHDIPATFMVPGQVIDEHPGACRDIASFGGEVGYHGYHHESVLDVPVAEERELMRRGIGRIEETFATRPRGNRSPPFALGPNTADLLEEFEFVYDSSLFGHDEPYRPRVPITTGDLRNLVELPVSWELDDAPYFLFSFFPYMSGFAAPSQVLEIWKAEFDGSYRAGGCFLLVVHPFCIGRHPRIALLDELISYIKSFPDVWFGTHLEVANDWRARQEALGLWDGTDERGPL